MNPLRYLGRFALIPFFLAAGPFLGGCCPPAVATPGGASNPALHTVTVVGRGEVHAKPDVARTSVGVEVTAPTVAEATKLANARMSELLGVLTKMGILEKDIRTSNFSINFERPDLSGGIPLPEPTPALAPQKSAGGPRTAPPAAPLPAPRAGFYRVSNTVDVTIHDMSKIGPVLDAAVAAGANNVWGVTFGLDATDALEAQAREKAVADARARAQALVKLQGRSLGEVVSVSEVVNAGPGFPQPMMMGMSAKMSDGVPVSAGEISYSTQIEVVYALGGTQASQPLPR